ncbi:MAG TPA: glycine oxidase ThiO [Rhizomicrobium sp.]|nr:glycine oxidase ThiO [Rhizomicrobium sp.]
MKVVIVGAGIAGLSLGWRLAQSGASVTVLERAQPGAGATLASAGMIAPTAEHGDETSAEAKFGRASAALWPSFAAEIEQMSGRKIGFRPEGTLLIAQTGDEFAQLQRRGASLPSMKSLSTADALALEPMLAPGIAGALFDPDEAQVDNRAVGLALAVAFIRAGGMLQTNETAVRIDVADNRAAAAVSPFATYHADAIVLAAGAWTARIQGLPPKIMPPVIPVKGEMIALEPGGPLPTHVIWGNEVYLVPRNGRLFVGATVARDGFDTSLTDAAADWLRAHAVGLMPALAEWETAEHWAGLRPGSPDDLPILGATALDGLFVASGQYRNGILLAPAIAEALRSLILERRSSVDISAFDPRRFTKPLLAKESSPG